MPQSTQAYLGEGEETDRSERATISLTRGETMPTASEHATGTDAAESSSASLPRHISGGFKGLAADLDRRSRDWTMMVRLLDQQRLHLETAEAEREKLYESLEAIIPEVKEAGRLLGTLMERTKAGDVSGNLSGQFTDNLRALDKLENLSQSLTANLLWMRSGWEQYARSVIGAQKMRDE